MFTTTGAINPQFKNSVGYSDELAPEPLNLISLGILPTDLVGSTITLVTINPHPNPLGSDSVVLDKLNDRNLFSLRTSGEQYYLSIAPVGYENTKIQVSGTAILERDYTDTFASVAGMTFNTQSSEVDSSFVFEPVSIPEPSTFAILGVAAFTFLMRRKRTEEPIHN